MHRYIPILEEPLRVLSQKVIQLNINQWMNQYVMYLIFIISYLLNSHKSHIDVDCTGLSSNKHSVSFLTCLPVCFPSQIRLASRVNAKTMLDIDNAKLAADDFKMK